MGQFDRILQQVKDAESDIYETMQTELGIDRARRHTTDADRSGFEGIFSISPEDKASEHFILAKGALDEASGAEKDEL
jgi:hypothetical protein